MLQVSWATAGQGRSQCCLHKAKNTTWVQEKDWAFMRGQTQRAAAQGLEFRNIHISAAAVRQGSKWQKVITKGTFHCTGSGELSAREGGGWKSQHTEQQLTCAPTDVQHLPWEQPAAKALFSLGSQPADSLNPFAAWKLSAVLLSPQKLQQCLPKTAAKNATARTSPSPPLYPNCCFVIILMISAIFRLFSEII